MPISDTVTTSTLFDMVLPEFRKHRPYSLELEAARMAAEILEKLGAEYAGNLVGLYADIVAYTIDMKFNWPEQMLDADGEVVEDTGPPEAYTNLEVWWEQQKAGADMLSQYQFAITQIDARVWQFLVTALRRATRTWKPIEWREEQELTEKQIADPLSSPPEETPVTN